MPIVTLATFKAYIRDEGNGLDDSILQGYLDASVAGLSNGPHGCSRQWAVAAGPATARSFKPKGLSDTLPIYDCTTITSVVDNGVTLTAGSGYEAEPLDHLSASGETVPYYKLVKPNSYWYSNSGLASVVVTATWGWAVIPPQIIEAVLILGKELCNNQDVRYGIVGVADGVVTGIRTNPIVRKTVETYTHPAGIGVG